LARTCATPSTCATPNDSNRSGPLIFSNSTSAGSGIGSSLEGQIAQFQRFDVYSTTAANWQKRGGLYAQDSWRVTPRLPLIRRPLGHHLSRDRQRSRSRGFTDLNAGGIRVAGVGGAMFLWCRCDVWRGERGD
jgi:hypothetical protein